MGTSGQVSYRLTEFFPLPGEARGAIRGPRGEGVALGSDLCSAGTISDRLPRPIAPRIPVLVQSQHTAHCCWLCIPAARERDHLCLWPPAARAWQSLLFSACTENLTPSTHFRSQSPESASNLLLRCCHPFGVITGKTVLFFGI